MNEKNSIEARQRAIKAIKGIANYGKAKKEVKGKDIRSAKKAVDTISSTVFIQIPTQLLHLQSNGAYWLQSSDRSRTLAEVGSWSLSEIRSEGAKTPVLLLQYSSRGNGSGSLYQDAKGNRPRSHGSAPKRQTSKRKSSSILFREGQALRREVKELRDLIFRVDPPKVWKKNLVSKKEIKKIYKTT